MATVEQLTEAATALTASVNGLADTVSTEAAQVATAIQSLKDQIAAGSVTGIDPAALDPLLANLQGIAAATDAAKAAVEAIYMPDAAPADPV